MSRSSLKVLENPLFDEKIEFTVLEKNWISEARPCRTYITLKCKFLSSVFKIKKNHKETNANDVSTQINIYENGLEQKDDNLDHKEDVIGYFRFWEASSKESSYPCPAYVESRIIVMPEFFKNLYKVLFQDKANVRIVCEIKNLRESNDIWEIEKTPDLLVRNLVISRQGDGFEWNSDKAGQESIKDNDVKDNEDFKSIIWFIGKRALRLIKKIF